MTPETVSPPVDAVAVGSHRPWRNRAISKPAVVAWAGLAVLLVGTGGFLYYIARGTTFWFDEWDWIAYRRGSDVGTFLRSYNGHFSLIPIAIYRLLFATVGLASYGPYRAVAVIAHLVCGALVFVYARRRIGSYLALCAAALILLLGAGWQDVIWPFQMAWLISLAAGLAALIMLDRRDRTGNVAAACLLGVSLASSGVGVVFALGLVVDVGLVRRRWRDAWIVAAPLALYGLWWLTYQGGTTLSPARLVPRFVADSAAAAVGGLAGATAPRPTSLVTMSGELLTWGRPLAVVALALIIWRLIRVWPPSPRVVTLATMLGAFWVLTAFTRASIIGGSQAWQSRYVYVAALLLVLLAVELLRGISVSRPVALLIGAGVAVAVVLNVANFRNAAFDLRATAKITRADLGALEIGRPLAAPDYVLRGLPGSPFLAIRADAYFAAAKAFGTPASTPTQIAADPDGARLVADQELIHIHAIAPHPASGHLAVGPRPPVVFASGAVTGRGSCVLLRSGNGAAARSEIAVRGTSPRLVITAQGGPATVGVRRFAAQFQYVGTVLPSTRSTVRIGPDLSTRRWDVLVVAASRASVCGLS